MLLRFCAYGFLKNQRYFEPYMMLILLERGLSFFWIGVLEALRALISNLLEIPSGAIADTWGRRRSMVVSFLAYVVSFLLFGFAGSHIPLLLSAVVLFGVGDAFRSGTHKAMIRTFLRLEGREEELTAFYGTTRSWSKIGSALGVVLGSLWVALTGDLDGLFFLVLIPYGADLLNLATYPAELDGKRSANISIGAVFKHLKDVAKEVLSSRPLRTLLFESAGFMGVFRSTKDYIQPILLSISALLVTSWLVLEDASPVQSVALLIGPVYFLLFALSAASSRFANRFEAFWGGKESASRALWGLFTLCFFGLLAGDLLLHSKWLMVGGLSFLFVLEALWRPIFLSRVDGLSEESHGATILSVESQARSITTAILAPSLGAALDYFSSGAEQTWWIVGALGVTVGLVFWLHSFGRRSS